tara:strand:- start:1670 stop:2239 length:570 start_codon:yes stop_codon:yes gene_type:complete
MIYIDVQHTGQAKRPNAMGASIGDKMEEQEAYWTGLYAFFCGMRLRELGYDVIQLSDGNYKARHARVNWYEENYPQEKSVYLACHINAGGGSSSIMFYDHRSGNGKKLAKCMADSMSKLTQISTSKTRPATPDDWTKNAYYTIKGVQKPVGICVEPFFIDNPENQELLTLDNIKRVGDLLADGVHLWYN